MSLFNRSRPSRQCSWVTSSKKLDGIASLRDESDLDGLKLDAVADGDNLVKKTPL